MPHITPALAATPQTKREGAVAQIPIFLRYLSSKCCHPSLPLLFPFNTYGKSIYNMSSKWYELVQQRPELAQQARRGVTEHAALCCCANKQEASGKGMGCEQPLLPKGHPHTCLECLETHLSDMSNTLHVWRRGTYTEQWYPMGLGKIQTAMGLTAALILLAACSAFSQGNER